MRLFRLMILMQQELFIFGIITHRIGLHWNWFGLVGFFLQQASDSLAKRFRDNFTCSIRVDKGTKKKLS
jgi:hypothetical protein